jgi:catechol 2,3-dioxygenase
MTRITPSHPSHAPLLPATLRMGVVSLTVSRLDRSVAWYQSALGLRVHAHEAARADLGDGETTVLSLFEDPRAVAAGRHAGLYHYALLYPTREELARAAVRLAETRTSVEGASDHGTHEAIYLPDPDGIGIELAADRPRDRWPTPERDFSGGGPHPLDFDSLLAAVNGEAPTDRVAAGLRVGHVHLHVGDVGRGLAFYRDLLGFEVWALLPSAAFVRAGDYHHHLGFNVWRGEGVPPRPGARGRPAILGDRARFGRGGLGDPPAAQHRAGRGQRRGRRVPRPRPVAYRAARARGSPRS